MARYVILGDGGHARAVRSWLVGVAHSRLTANDDDVQDGETVLIGLGDVYNRKRLWDRYADRVFKAGWQIMRGVVIDPSASIGLNVLVNTGAQIDHDCIVEDHCVIGPGAILCGAVRLGECCQIGAGAIILQGVHLDPGTKIAAGTLVVSETDLRRPQRLLSLRALAASLGSGGAA